MSSIHVVDSEEAWNETTIPNVSLNSNATYIPTDEELVMRKLLSFPIPEFNLFGDPILVDHIASEGPLPQIESDRACSSPIRHMPFDVLEVIFSHCLPTGRNPMMNEKEAPILLSHVCLDWRDAALSLPFLWSRIHFPIPVLPGQLAFPSLVLSDAYNGMFIQTVDYRCEMAKTWMLRSAGVPLHITIHESDPQTHERDALDKIIDSSIGHSLRWKSLELFISAESFERLSGKLSADKLPLLESLSVDDTGLSESFFRDQVKWAPLVIMQAPNLREVSIRDIPDRRFWGFREDMTVDKIATILRRCNALVKCRFEIDDHENPELVPRLTSRPILLRNLKEFSLQNWGGPLVQFFELLVTPHLEYLQYHSKKEHHPSDLLAFLPRVSSTLQTLVIHITQYSRKDFIQCLRYCPRLKCLVNIPPYPECSSMIIPRVTETATITRINTTRHWSDREILKVLTTLEGDGMSYLVPDLQVFESFEPVNVSEDDLVNFISMKNAGNIPGMSKIKGFTMVMRESHILEHIEPFIKDGLEVNIRFAPSGVKGPIPAYYDIGSAGHPLVSVSGSPAF